jgi:hypothetical protein
MIPGDGDTRHGTVNGYTNLDCHCQPCKAAWAAKMKDRRLQRRAQGLAPDDPRHGKYSTYSNWMCRCDACFRAWMERSRDASEAKTANL